MASPDHLKFPPRSSPTCGGSPGSRAARPERTPAPGRSGRGALRLLLDGDTGGASPHARRRRAVHPVRVRGLPGPPVGRCAVPACRTTPSGTRQFRPVGRHLEPVRGAGRVSPSSSTARAGEGDRAVPEPDRGRPNRSSIRARGRSFARRIPSWSIWSRMRRRCWCAAPRSQPQYFIAPIDECYRLVGLIKTRWAGHLRRQRGRNGDRGILHRALRDGRPGERAGSALFRRRRGPGRVRRGADARVRSRGDRARPGARSTPSRSPARSTSIRPGATTTPPPGSG